MKFPDPLIKGTLIKRYKRFLSDIEIADTGEVVVAHCANPGSEVWVSPARNPDRKLKYSWELVRVGRSLVGINTMYPNAIVAEAIEKDVIPELAGYGSLRREVKYGVNSRIDILLQDEAKPDCFVEIKNVTLRRGKVAEFPDSITARGAKHLGELSREVEAGNRAVMLYLVQRGDCQAFDIARDIDPTYDAELTKARKAGVEVLICTCRVTTKGVDVRGRLSFV
jgi:sugar fermentation stimulation protein A